MPLNTNNVFHLHRLLLSSPPQLLCHQDQRIQQVALECLLTYKDTEILPYK